MRSPRFQSNALWPAGVCHSKWNDNISTDTHPTAEAATQICRKLKEEGFAGSRVHFPLYVWVSFVQDPPRLPKEYVQPKPAEQKPNASSPG